MPQGADIGRLLMVVGALVFLLGLTLTAGGRLPLGRLPGDLVVRRDGLTLYFPLATCLLLSLLLSLVLSWLRR